MRNALFNFWILFNILFSFTFTYKPKIWKTHLKVKRIIFNVIKLMLESVFTFYFLPFTIYLTFFFCLKNELLFCDFNFILKTKNF